MNSSLLKLFCSRGIDSSNMNWYYNDGQSVQKWTERIKGGVNMAERDIIRAKEIRMHFV